MDTNEMDVMDAAPGSLGELVPSAQPAAAMAPRTAGERIAYVNLLHRDVERQAEAMRAMGVRLWQYAVVLGYQLTLLKQELPRGEYNILFSAGKRNTCVTFGFTKQTASRYTRLYKACAARYRKICEEGNAELSELMVKPLPEIAERIAGLTDAATLRQAYFDFRIIEPPASPAEILEGNRNEAGRPAEEEEGACAARESWEEARKLALHAAGKLATETASYIETGRLGFLERAEKELLLATLRRAAAAVEDSLRDNNEEVIGNRLP